MSSTTNSFKFNNTMPLYIPRVDTRALSRNHPMGSEEYLAEAKEFIAKQFKFQKIGEVDRIDLVTKKTPDSYTFYIAFVHFKEWFNTAPALALQQTIFAGNEKATLRYHKDWYWIVTENRKPRSVEEVDLHKVVEAQKKEIEELTEMLGTFVSQTTGTRKLGRALAAAAEDVPLPPPGALVREASTLPMPCKMYRSIAQTEDDEDMKPFQRTSVQWADDSDEDMPPPPGPATLVRQNTEVPFKMTAQMAAYFADE